MDVAAEVDKIAGKLREGKLILFVGSGMSAPCYPTWKGLLQELIDQHLKDDKKAQREARKLLAENQFLDAAWVAGAYDGGLASKLAGEFKPKHYPEARYKLVEQ